MKSATSIILLLVLIITSCDKGNVSGSWDANPSSLEKEISNAISKDKDFVDYYEMTIEQRKFVKQFYMQLDSTNIQKLKTSTEQNRLALFLQLFFEYSKSNKEQADIFNKNVEKSLALKKVIKKRYPKFDSIDKDEKLQSYAAKSLESVVRSKARSTGIVTTCVDWCCEGFYNGIPWAYSYNCGTTIVPTNGTWTVIVSNGNGDALIFTSYYIPSGGMQYSGVCEWVGQVFGHYTSYDACIVDCYRNNPNGNIWY